MDEDDAALMARAVKALERIASALELLAQSAVEGVYGGSITVHVPEAALIREK